MTRGDYEGLNMATNRKLREVCRPGHHLIWHLEWPLAILNIDRYVEWYLQCFKMWMPRSSIICFEKPNGYVKKLIINTFFIFVVLKDQDSDGWKLSRVCKTLIYDVMKTLYLTALVIQM